MRHQCTHTAKPFVVQIVDVFSLPCQLIWNIAQVALLIRSTKFKNDLLVGSSGSKMSCRHSDSRHAGPINGSAFYRYSTLLAIAAPKAFRPFNGSVLMLTDRVCVKYGPCIHYPKQQLCVSFRRLPLSQSPRCYACLRMAVIHISDRKDQRRYNSQSLGLSNDKSKTKLLTKLKKMIGEIRELEPVEGICVASVNGGTLFDWRLPGASLRFGPFSSVQDFHRHLRDDMDLIQGSTWQFSSLLGNTIETSPIVFTHGDLSSLNILARVDDIAGIIDWETAGWYPSYWE